MKTRREKGKRTVKAKRRSRRRVDALGRYLKGLGPGEEGRLAREEFALKMGTTLAYLDHLVLGFRVASMDFAIRVEKATHGIVRCEDLYPDGDWRYMTQRKPALGELENA